MVFSSSRSCHICAPPEQHHRALPHQLYRSDSLRLLPSKQLTGLSKCKCYPCVSAWALPQDALWQVKQEESFATSASAIAAAFKSLSSSNIKFTQKIRKQPRGVFSGPSSDFLELCQKQLAILDTLLEHKAKLTIFVRPVESYGTPDLELQQMVSHPKWTLGEHDESLVIIGDHGTANVLRSVESALLSKEIVEVSDLSALVIPMVKDMFLVGVVVAECVASKVEPLLKGSELKAVKPEWPPQKENLQLQDRIIAQERKLDSPSSSNGTLLCTPEQKFEVMKIVQSLAICCVMDQRTLLLQHSSWQRGIRVGELIEQVRGPLAAMRTLGKMLQPQMKEGEISTDILEDILVQGEQLKDAVQQFQEVIYLNENPANSLNPNRQSGQQFSDPPGVSDNRNLAMRDDSNFKQEQIPLNSIISVGHSSDRDKEAPMPPVALAPLMHREIESCDVSEILIDLVNSGSVLARRKGQAVELKQNPADGPHRAAIDEYSLRQVFSNLLDSSLQHILPGGWVQVQVMQAPGGGVLVTIDDNGPDLSLLSQAEALAPLGSGLQIGGHEKLGRSFVLSVGAELSVAREILEQFGGVLRITSPFLPQAIKGMGGTRLEVWVPSPASKDEH